MKELCDKKDEIYMTENFVKLLLTCNNVVGDLFMYRYLLSTLKHTVVIMK
jgi:hypothetical protein